MGKYDYFEGQLSVLNSLINICERDKNISLAKLLNRIKAMKEQLLPIISDDIARAYCNIDKDLDLNI